MKITDEDRLCARGSTVYASRMRTDTLSIPFWSPEEVEAALRRALAHIEARRVLAYPTETVYGFGGGIDRDSVDALVRAQGPSAGQAVPPAHRRPAT